MKNGRVKVAWEDAEVDILATKKRRPTEEQFVQMKKFRKKSISRNGERVELKMWGMASSTGMCVYTSTHI